MYDVIISGYYGFDNSGDDAILMAMVDDLKKCRSDIRIAVLSKNPEKTALAYGVDSIYRFNIFKVISTMKKARLFINGGGNLIQDVTSSRSLFYYLGTIAIAKLLGLKVMLYANGVGPVGKPLNRRLTRRIINKVDLITLREETSRQELASLGIDRPEILTTADPALGLTPAGEQQVSDLFAKYGIDRSRPLVGFSIRKWSGYEEYSRTIVRLADHMSSAMGVTPVFIPMHFPSDLAVADDMASRMKEKAYVLRNRHGVAETLGIIGKLDMIIGMRLHALIYAVNLGVPLIGLIYDPKVEGFLEYVEQPSAGHVSELDFERFRGLVESTWKNRDAIRRKMAAEKPELTRKAFANAEIAVKLLD